jgi:uncharacterized protein DUF6308
VTKAHHFNDLLAEIPTRDLWLDPRSVLESDSAADQLHAALKTLDDVGSVMAGKPLAAKCSRLMPKLDSEVQALLRPHKDRF